MFLFWALLLLGVLVLVHEFGHFSIAKLTNVKVLRFSIGFGPKLIGFQWGETEYRVSLVPFGGYVKMLAQESSEDIPPGVLAVDPDGGAAKAGLRPGDRIRSVFNEPVNNWTEIQIALIEHDDLTVPIEVERLGEPLSFEIERSEIFPCRLGEVDRFARIPEAHFPDVGATIGDHEPDRRRAFYHKPLWVRFAVVFAGPAASLLFPILIYFIYFLSVDELPSTRIGQVLADSPAIRAGLMPGDRIVEVDGVETPYWSSMAKIIRKHAGDTIALKVERGGAVIDLSIVPETASFTNQIGDKIKHGRIGIVADTIPPIVGPGGEASPAFKAGVRLGDRVTALNGQPMTFIWELEQQLEEIRSSGRAFLLTLSRPAGGEETEAEEIKVKVVPARRGDGSFWTGLYSADTIVDSLGGGSPAEEAGFRAGDRVLSVEGRAVSAWVSVEQVLREKMEQPIRFVIERNGRPHKLVVKQKKEIKTGEMGEEYTVFHFGAWSAVKREQWLEGEMVPVENTLAFAASSSWTTLVDITLLELRVFGKLLHGDIPIKMLGGPIMIFDIAGRAAERGWQYYLWIMALISINLGILNFLPIPVLDGGHLMFFTIEGLTRRPINQHIKERAIMAGFIMLMMLMALVFKNDIERYWDSIFGS